MFRFYILRNSGLRVWLADWLVTFAGWLNPAKPWRGLSESFRLTGEMASKGEYWGDEYDD